MSHKCFLLTHVLVLGDFYSGTKTAILGNIFNEIPNWQFTIPQLEGIQEYDNMIVHMTIELYPHQIQRGSVEQQRRTAYAYRRRVGDFSLVLQQCNNHNVEMADQMSIKFGVNIIFRTGSCLIMQAYLPGRANSSRTGESCWLCRALLVIVAVILLKQMLTLSNQSHIKTGNKAQPTNHYLAFKYKFTIINLHY